ncbi:HK97 gp10 family phage protein [Rhodobacter sphaeroides]|jgi:phage protein, HK97 gp10 family|uniref:Phage protein, HK97 gp10 family n=1 Tax=Cereibacter sphaeroides (strain ATCC 17023 / DSM 158 / JCM 6121 / CCUG 31486 / LMG 2827 / NBRC 12203 / NCIMB 8253 / ATH 2.4.1.) TaxID=272943 RepID=Q3J226_CERS4|nr:HK97-gp10 family putative phage morphogenesis protein [Cereibacter sphaeroides]ABA79158.2 phage protein, HK97 gp10 family [Cereibacter sphaeroides 2.4.1]AXC61369.1 HK97 gp10 family phage protein [Cereibacter sphaeroides 2.4.1]MVX47668.1 HK97 gp10 family phage protein [Cereibacter sphaeroides]QHA10965.1 HK97 gp10 family phage protein [Cereibacter sphaeroides]QHA13452.1 HK97 gp10 family phage protein [Cereibacter sphaeroides]
MAKNKSGMEIDKKSFRELEKNLMSLEKLATQKRLIKTSMKKAMQPVADAAQSAAPVDEGDLRDSIIVTDKLNKTQKRLERKEGKHSFVMYAGAGSPKGHLLEFGTEETSPQPYLRPAWQTEKENVLNILKDEMAARIQKAIKRQDRARAKAAKG